MLTKRQDVQCLRQVCADWPASACAHGLDGKLHWTSSSQVPTAVQVKARIVIKTLFFAQALIFTTFRFLAFLSDLIEFSQVSGVESDRQIDGWTDQQHAHVSLPSLGNQGNRDRFTTYSYRHCQPTYVYHYCSLPPLISLTDAHIMRKAFDIFILYLLISRAYF